MKKLLNFFQWLNIMPPAPQIHLGTFEDDRKAIESDWRAIGDDFNRAIEQFESEHPELNPKPRNFKTEGAE